MVMKKMIIKNFLLLTCFFNIIIFCLINLFLNKSSYKCELINIDKIQSNLTEAVYSISSKKFGHYNNLIYKHNEQILLFSNKIKGWPKNIKLIPSKQEENTYYIEFEVSKKIFGLNKTEISSIVLYDNISSVGGNYEMIKWKIFEVNNNNYLIQNSFSKKFWKTRDLIYLDCSGEFENINNTSLIDNNHLINNPYTFKIVKLFEEMDIKEEHVEIIEREPVDILIKYIDLSDPYLKRDGIKQIKKDKDNGELKYSLRSIFRFIPWVRKIFILMPNEKVSFLKPISEINDKIVYVKDKDLLGFDSESSTTFQYILFKLKNFGISDNFLLMDDDYFFGREMKKTDFFYFDENAKKVVPFVTSMIFNYYEVHKKELIADIFYSFQMKCNETVMAHTPTGWQATKSRSLLFLMKVLGRPLISGGFDHNAIPVNLNDIEEIYNLIYLRYRHSFLTLNSISRTRYDLQYQILYNTYGLNKHHRKVKQIFSRYYDVKNAKNVTLGTKLFCINTGFKEYNETDFDNLKMKLEELFPEPTKYEIISNKEINLSIIKSISNSNGIDEQQ